MQKKHRVGLVFLFVIVLVTAGGFFLLNQTDAGFFLKCHFTKEPRMNCEVVLNVDGLPYALTETDVNGLPMASGAENTVSDFESGVSGCSFKCKGGEYGEQPFQISFRYADGKTALIPVRVFLGNNWEMSDVILTVEADTSAESYCYTLTLVVNGKTYTNSGKADFASQEFVSVSNI